MRRSRNVLLATVFLAFMLDGVLWTIVVPIFPPYLHQLESVAEVVADDVIPTTGASDDVTADGTTSGGRFALADDSFYDWVKDGAERRSVMRTAAGRFWSRWLASNWTLLPNGSITDDDYEQLSIAADAQHKVSLPTGSSADHHHKGVDGDDVVDFQRQDGRLGWLYASKAVMQMLANPFVGLLVHRCGHVVPFIVGAFILLTSSTLYSVGGSYAVLLVARAIHGLGSSCIGIAGMTTLAVVYNDERDRSGAMGIALGGLGAGILVGYPFGGLANQFSPTITIPFMFVSCLAIVELALQIWVLSPVSFTNPNASISGFDPFGASLNVLRDPYIIVAAVVLLLPEMSMATLELAVPAWMLDTMNAEKWQIGTVFIPDSFGFFLGCNVFGFLAYKLGQWKVAFGSLLLAGLCLFMIPFATKAIHLVGPHLGFGFALGMTDASIMPLLAHLVDTRHTAVYSSVYAIAQTSISLGFALGPAVGGQLVKLVGFNWLLRGLAILVMAGAPLNCFLRDPPCREENLSILMKENGRSSVGRSGPTQAQHHGQTAATATLNSLQATSHNEQETVNNFPYRQFDQH